MTDLDKTNNSVELNMEKGREGEQTEEVKKSSRRSDIDLIRVALTWGILLYHVVLIYAPYAAYYVRIIPDTEPSRLGWATSVPEWHLAALWFIFSMNAWNMPMFFFLSGIS